MNINIHIEIPIMISPHPHPPYAGATHRRGQGMHGVGEWGDINIHIDINMNIDIHSIMNMNIEDYIRYYLLFIKYY